MRYNSFQKHCLNSLHPSIVGLILFITVVGRFDANYTRFFFANAISSSKFTAKRLEEYAKPWLSILVFYSYT